MRIGFDGTSLLGERTGIGWYTADLIAALAAGPASGDALRVWPISWRTAGEVAAPAPGVEVVRRLAPSRPLRALWERAPFPPLETFLRCDVFHATNYLCPPAWRAATVVSVHDLSFVRQPDTCVPAVRRFAELLPRVLRRADAVLCVSSFTAAEVAAWKPEVAAAGKLRVVHNGFHARPARDAAEAGVDGPYVLVLGTLNARKNLPLVLDALQVLHARGSDLRLVLAGADDPLLDARALAAERGFTADTVLRVGYVTDERAAALLAGARALAFPSLYEGFGMPVVEAMDAGIPVVAARSGATVEIAGGAAALVDPDDVEGFAGALERVHLDDSYRAALVAAGRERSRAFTWAEAAARTYAVYRELAAS